MNKTTLEQASAWLESRIARRAGAAVAALLVVTTVAAAGVNINQGSKAATGGALYLTPASSSIVGGSTFAVTVRENSGANAVNAVQAVVTYNPSQLQLVSVAEGSAFPMVAATDTATPGVIRLARGTALRTSVTGDQPVVTLTFKALSAGTAAIGFDSAASLLAYAADGTNMLSSATGGTYEVGARLSLSPPAGTYPAGASVPVSILVEADTSKINAVQASLVYDSTKLKFGGISDSTAFPTVAATDTATPGVIRLARGTAVGTASSGTQTVATVNFTVLGTSGTTAINLDQQYSFVAQASDGKNILVDLKGSTFNLASGTPTINTVSPLSAPSSGGAIVTITGTNFASGMSVRFGSAGSTNVSVTSATTLTALVPAGIVGPAAITITNPDGQSAVFNGFRYTGIAGDTNGDGRVNAIDISTVITRDGQNYPAADFNGDGTVGAADMAIVLGNWTW